MNRDLARRVVSGGHSLEVLRLPAPPGGADAAPLVLLHEGLGSVSTWRDFPARLAGAAGLPALVYSRYGHGGSDVLREARRPDFMHQEAERLDELLRQLGVRSPILVGHSDGASIALIHAAMPATAAARALVFFAPHVFVEARTLAAIAAARAAFASADLALRLGRHHRDPLRTFRGWNDVWLDPRFRSWDIRPLLERVECPVLAIQGEDDAYGTMAQLDEIAARVPAPVAQLRLERCGHSPHREHAERVLAAVTRFIAALAPPDDPGALTGAEAD